MNDNIEFLNNLSPIMQTEFRLAKHLRKVLHLDEEVKVDDTAKPCQAALKENSEKSYE